MARTLLTFAIAMSALGCGVDFTRWVPDRFAGGERIRFLHWRPASGESVVYGLWDAELRSECAIRPTADGELRCVPRASSAGPVYHLDAECSSPAFVAGSRGDEVCRDAYAVEAMPLDDDRLVVTRVGRVGPEADLPAELYARQPNGTCAPEETASERAPTFEAVPLADLVRAERRVIGRAGALEEVRTSFDDGAWRVQRRFAEGQGCTLYDLGEGPDVRRCLTGAQVDTLPRFGDPDCRAPVLPSFVGMPEPTFGLVTNPRTGERELRAVGALSAVEQAQYRYDPDEGTCRASPSSLPVYALGEPLAPSTQPLHRRETDGRGARGRVRWDRWVGPDGRVTGQGGGAATGYLHDRVLDVRCVWQRLDGGDPPAVRCLPYPRASVRYFADASCTEPAAGLSALAGGQPRYGFRFAPGAPAQDSCGRTFSGVEAAFGLGAPTTGHELDAAGECVPAPDDIRAWRLANEVPLDLFARMDDVRE